MCTYWKNKIELKPYVSVKTPAGFSHGGSQTWFAAEGEGRRESVLSSYGCGLVALGDLFLMAARRYPHLGPSMDNRCFRPFLTGREEEPLTKSRYLAYLDSLGRSYLWIFPKLGANAWQLLLAVWLYFRRSGFGGRARWGALTWNIPRRVHRMLENGLPVVLSVGPNLNPFDRNQKVPLYQLQNGALKEAARVRAHYMNVTGMCQDEKGALYFQVSSWGKCYYLSWAEYKAYRRRQAPFLGQWVSNVLYVQGG